MANASKVEQMSREELAAWYESTVGYSPIEDEPSMSTDELRSLVLGYLAERS